MRDQNEIIRDFAIKMQEAEDNGEVIITVTREEAHALRSIAAFWMAGQGVGFFASRVRSVLVYIGFFIVAWVSFKAGLVDWLKAILR